MRVPDIRQETLFSTAVPEEGVPKEYPLHPIQETINEALSSLRGCRPKDGDEPLPRAVDAIPA